MSKHYYKPDVLKELVKKAKGKLKNKRKEFEKKQEEVLENDLKVIRLCEQYDKDNKAWEEQCKKLEKPFWMFWRKDVELSELPESPTFPSVEFPDGYFKLKPSFLSEPTESFSHLDFTINLVCLGSGYRIYRSSLEDPTQKLENTLDNIQRMCNSQQEYVVLSDEELEAIL